MDPEEIRRVIASFPRWHYKFNLKGQPTPIYREDQTTRHEQRRRYFFDPLVEFLGGSLTGKRILDLGCNAGFWALSALDAGCSFVLGVDGRQMHVEQANFVLEVNEVSRSRYAITCANIFELDFKRFGTFEIVFCLGLLYHVSRPVELIEKIASVNSEILVIDTALSLAPGAYFEMRYESTEVPTNTLDRPIVLYPTALAVLHLARQFGYSAWMLKPNFSDYTGCWDYQHQKRRAFICMKGAKQPGPPFELEDEIEACPS